MELTDTDRLNFVLPVINAQGAEADRRTMLLAEALMRGLEGRDLIDHAIKASVE